MHLHPSPLPALHARALRGVAAGMSHSAAVTAMGEVYAWGDAGHLSSFADEGRAGGRLGLPGRGGRRVRLGWGRVVVCSAGEWVGRKEGVVVCSAGE